MTPEGYRYHWLWRVHELDRIDKHRRLAVTAAALRHPFVSIPEGVEPETTFFHAEGPVRDGQLLLSYTGADAGVGSYFDLGVAVTDANAGADIVAEMLESLLQHVDWVVWRIQAASAQAGS